jgi:predicted metalloprotease with PDZ domain
MSAWYFAAGQRTNQHGRGSGFNIDDPKVLSLEPLALHRKDGQQTVTVATVDPSGSAAASGIQNGDRIVAVQLTQISEPADEKLMWTSLAVPHQLSR